MHTFGARVKKSAPGCGNMCTGRTVNFERCFVRSEPSSFRPDSLLYGTMVESKKSD